MNDAASSLLELLGMLVTSPHTLALFALLVAAGVIDYRTMRIPNWLTVGGILVGLLSSTLSTGRPLDGFLGASAGMAVGLAVLLPFYALRVMGAGDVKLMAMAGAFLGPSATVAAILATLVAGGLLAVAVALRSGQFARMLANVGGLTLHDGASVGKMPFGVAIATGTIGYLVLAQLGLIGSAWS